MGGILSFKRQSGADSPLKGGESYEIVYQYFTLLFL
jgi:hypothetical protein